MTDESALPLNGLVDVEDFIALSATHQRRLFQYILSILPGLQDAEDVLQETNLILWRKFSEFKKGSDFLAWASSIAFLEVLKVRKTKALRSTLCLDDELIDELAEEAVENAGYLDSVREALQGCVSKISQADRDLITRRYLKGTSGEQLAEELGRPRNSIYKSLGRIRQMLLQCIHRSLARAELPGGTA